MKQPKFNSMMLEVAEDAPTFTEAMAKVTAAEFGIRIAKCFYENKSSTAIHFIQQAFRDCEDDNGIYWDAFKAMLARLTEEPQGGEKAGVLEIGLNEAQDEIILNVPVCETREGFWHITFSAEQARGLAMKLVVYSTMADVMPGLKKELLSK